MQSCWASVLRELLSDRAALYGVATKASQAMAGLVTAAFVLHYFSPGIQGFYYTFGTVLALQVFIELGLSAVINIFAAHEWSKLSLDQSGSIRGDPDALARLRALTRNVFRWYLIGGLLLLALLAIVGFWFFGTSPDSDAVSWKYPWLAMCLLASITFGMTPAWALLTGCGQLASLNAFRMAEVVIRSVVLWACVAWGASLWSAVAASAFSAGAGMAFLALRYRRFFATLLETSRRGEFNWRRDVAPIQVRFAISWLSGYFAFSLFTPAMFHFHGAEDAGRIGMTWALVGGLSGVSSTWLQVQAPKFAMMVARKQFEQLDRVAWRTTLIGTSIFLAGSGVGLGALLLLEAHRPEIAGRLLPLGPIVVFLGAEFLQQISMVQSTYLRSFKQEPFLKVSLASGFVTGIGTILLTPSMGAYGPATSYFLGIVIALAWGTAIFFRMKQRWTSTTA